MHSEVDWIVNARLVRVEELPVSLITGAGGGGWVGHGLERTV